MLRPAVYFRWYSLATALSAGVLAFGCNSPGPTAPERVTYRPAAAWGPETPHFNLQVILRDPNGGGAQGHVKFRQPNDAFELIELGTSVRTLAPNTHYRLQRATDAPDGMCSSTAWLTLGKGTVAQDIVTDENGDGAEDLFRVLTNPPGTQFDIRFRVIDAITSAVVLISGCYEFTISL